MSLCLDNPLHLPLPGSQPSPSDSLVLDLDLNLDGFDFDSLVEDTCSLSSASSVINAGTFNNNPTTPQSSTILSPRSSLVDLSPVSSEDPNAVDALSKHHFERYLHYKALAAQAEIDARTALYSLLDPLSMENDIHTHSHTTSANPNMISLQAQPQFFGEQHWAQSFAYQPQPAAMQQVYHTQAHAHAQAQIHLQAHEAARAAAVAQQQQQQQQAQRSMSMTSFYMPTNRSSVDGNAAPMWSRQGSISTTAASPPFPSTPSYVPVAPTQALPTFSSLTNAGASSFAPVEGENELDEDEDDELEGEDGQSPLANGALANLHGGGRGYVPGKTPDDPKKRHKCQICGRGFARAFNLKSHLTTHDPLRPKPHQCPHPTCKRGFSRLHDLERHRQGIHSDGPLVDAKRQGVSPSVIRAQSRIQRRAETGRLI